jgi:hypothetical protein
MSTLYKLWIHYYIFIRNVYSNRWKEMGSSVFALAICALFIYLMFFVILTETIMGFNGLLQLFKKELPVGPIVTGISFTIIIGITAILNRVRIDNKFEIKEKH